MKRMKSRLQLLLLAAVGMAILYAVMQRQRDALSEPTPTVEEDRGARERHPPLAATTATFAPSAVNRDATLALPDRTRVVPQSNGDAFAKLSWVAPAPVVHAAPPPPPAPVVPVAPALPFTFVGLMEQGTTQPQAFLSKGNSLLVVAAGDVIDNNTYRVDSLSTQQIVITYLPLNTPQTLTILGISK